ncbi:MAG: GAF domain-containing protein [Nitrospirae bacterium]|nr:GAF domain-containing protein [Nitrospirota bacterium]
MKPINVYHPADYSCDRLKEATAAFPIAWRPCAGQIGPVESPAVVMLPDGSASSAPPNAAICVIGGSESGPLLFSIKDQGDAEGFASGLFKVLPALADTPKTAPDDGYVREFVDIGIQLTAERDLERLLNLILRKAMQLTASDAASLYLVIGEDSEKHLVFKLANNQSRRIVLKEQTMPMTPKSVAGYVALTGKALIIDDAYIIPSDRPYSLNRAFDESHNYRSKSMLVIPMRNHQGDIIGVLQMINRKPSFDMTLHSPEVIEQIVLPFTHDIKDRMTALANLAAVAIENNQLYESIRRLFDGFVQAAVTAIEQRDPTTKGHSLRVSVLTVELAKVVDHLDSGRFADARFTREMLQELRWAGLLHDFGKVGVREDVLLKSHKLYPFELERIENRFRHLKKCVETDTLHKKLNALMHHECADCNSLFAGFENEEAAQYARLDSFLDAVVNANLPTVLPAERSNMLEEMRNWQYPSLNGGDPMRVLLDDEARVLSIPKGSLDEKERLEIESHVTHTYNFLIKIPWTRDLKRLPDIAYAHHEKLNGRGYPRGLSGPEIPVQAKMMAIADIYDALTASDRPYKKAVPIEKALDILGMEAKGGALDSELVNVFIESKVWQSTERLRQI